MLPVLPARPTWKSQLAEGLGKGIATGAALALKLGLEKMKQHHETDVLKKFGEEILKQDPDNPRNKTIASVYGLDMPFEHKQQLIKGLLGSDPWSLSRQYYLNRRDIADQFDRQIKNYSYLLKSGAFTDRNQERFMQDEIQRLMKEREQGLAVYDAHFRSSIGIDPPKLAGHGLEIPPPPKVQGYGDEEEEESDEDEDDEELSGRPRFSAKNAMQALKRSKQKSLTKFDPTNPQHVAKFRQLDKKFKGDRKKVNEILAREFKL